MSDRGLDSPRPVEATAIKFQVSQLVQFMSLSTPGTALTPSADLTNCDKEPLHIPAGIQGFGCMLVVRLSDLQIVSVSANIADWFNQGVLSNVGCSLNTCHPVLSHLVQDVLSKPEGSHSRRVSADICEGLAIVSAHHFKGLAILEVESIDDDSANPNAGLLERLFSGVEHKSVQALYQSTVEIIRDFTSFDRVMMYQFHEDDHGSVVAEVKKSEQESYLGLHYPAGDIPVPARRLYETKWIRTIANSHAPSIPLLPSLVGSKGQSTSIDDTPIDLTYADLRAISAIHLQYLRNMGVVASMSISIMSGGKLWGLIACHHSAVKVVSAKQRDACELAGSLLSVYLSSRRQEELLKRRVEISDNLTHHISSMANQDDFVTSIAKAAPWIASVFHADGFIWVHGEDCFHWGETPSELQARKLLEALDQQNQEPIVYTENLAQWRPDMGALAERLPGLMVLRLGQREGGSLQLFRAPYAASIHWAGDPSQSDFDGEGQLTPRKSFAKFTQSVQDRSLPWSRIDRETAETLLSTLNSFVVEQASRLRRTNDELRQLNTDLDAFAYAASHDLKEPLRGIRHHLFMLEQAGQLAGPAFDRGLSSMKRLVSRMGELLDGLLRFSRAGRQDLLWETFRLGDVVDQACDVAFGGLPPDNVQVTVAREATVVGDFACVREILSNLITNATKYNVRPVKELEIHCANVSETPLAKNADYGSNVVFVRDNGIGIPFASQQKIFDIFTRLHSQTEYGGGSGAGLTIVRRMVERHGGKITIESDGQSGSTFYFGWEPM